MNKTWERKIPFIIVFFLTVLATYGLLVIIDFVPEAPNTAQDAVEVDQKPTIEASATTETETKEIVSVVADPLPTKIIFDDLNREVTVLNPVSREIADLDAALLSGAVRHPDSADFSEPGNIFILGHSSYLPNVFNKNFQAFNGIQDLTWGDTIRVQSASMEYTYFVEEITKAAASDIIVPMTPGEAHLTLATCNSFGSKDDRFIVEAKLIDKKPL